LIELLFPNNANTKMWPIITMSGPFVPRLSM
jgi:hypothetical protein